MARREPKAWRGAFFFLQATLFAVLEVLAARELDGWLSVALYGIAVWNTALVVLGLWGLLLIAQKAQEAEVAS